MKIQQPMASTSAIASKAMVTLREMLWSTSACAASSSVRVSMKLR